MYVALVAGTVTGYNFPSRTMASGFVLFGLVAPYQARLGSLAPHNRNNNRKPLRNSRNNPHTSAI